jgi:hypothetical protein
VNRLEKTVTYRNTIRAFVATVVLAALTLVAPTPASAHGWTEPNAWAGGHTLGVNYLDRGSVVALWQRMGHAQFGGGCPGSVGCTYRTDGIFGQNTHNRTILWQAVYKDVVPDMVVDGIVGAQTWNAARFFNLRRTSENAGWVYHDYGPSARDFGMSYAKPFLTWFSAGWSCRADIIDHPTVRDAWLNSCV